VDIKTALSVVSRQAPCPHMNIDTRIGTGDYWAKCEDCGATVRQDNLDRSRRASADFDEAIATIQAALKGGKL
jgi:hypothetical protein